MNKVLIVDDHESMCDSLSHALASTNEFEVIGSLKSAIHAELYCMKLKPDLVLMDVCTEAGASGLDATKDIRKKYPDIKVIVMSGFDEITYAPRAKEVGAHAFVFKSKSLDYFVQVAKGVMEGESFFPKPKTIHTSMGEAPLTEREMEVLRLMCKHMTNKEIADELFITEHTVKYHKSNMLAKTGFKKAVDLAFHMISNGLINPLY
ncbi:MAG: response regulator transcription factor [Clostridia bacterium]|nr:response regulator transcription factor [Clostridia bacterium]MDD4680426.1 response regulator transcription factor [Clostridia bacterium]